MFLSLINVNSEYQGVKNMSELSSGCTCNFGFCINCVAYCQGSGYGLGTAVAQWLRYRATNHKVACSIADGIIGIFH
jgi:hypothetical protein